MRVKWSKVLPGAYRCGEHTIDREWRRNGGQRWVLRGPAVTNFLQQQHFPTLRRATGWLENKIAQESK